VQCVVSSVKRRVCEPCERRGGKWDDAAFVKTKRGTEMPWGFLRGTYTIFGKQRVFAVGDKEVNRVYWGGNI